MNFSKKQAFLVGLAFVVCGQLMLACSSETSATGLVPTQTVTSAVPGISATVSISLAPANPTAVPPSPTACPMIAADPIPYTVDQLISGSEAIFLGEITAFDPFVWNTPDGGISPDLCSIHYFQLAPAHVTIRENFKGNLSSGSSVTVLLANAPGSLPHILPIKTDIKIGTSFVWFLGELKNFRPENPQKPLNFPAVRGQFLNDENKYNQNKWSEITTSVGFRDIDFLKERIKNPPNPTPSVTK